MPKATRARAATEISKGSGSSEEEVVSFSISSGDSERLSFSGMPPAALPEILAGDVDVVAVADVTEGAGSPILRAAAAGAGWSLIVACGMALISEARGITGSGLRAAEEAAGAAGTAVEEEGLDTGGLGTPAEAEAGGTDGMDLGAEPGGLKGAKGDRGANSGDDAEGVRGAGGLRGPGLRGGVTDPTDTPAAGIGNPAEGMGIPDAGIGFGGNFRGGSLTGECEPVGKSGTGMVFWEGESLTIG